MRKFENSNSEVVFPDSIVFAFNPLYCVFKTTLSLNEVEFSVVCNGEPRTINVQLLNGKATIYFSRILQLFFIDYKHFRTLDFTIAIVDKRDKSNIFSASLLAIWGSLTLGDRYNAYGLFNFTGKSQYERTRIWFKKFPFKVSMFTVNPESQIKCTCDGKSVTYSSMPALSPGNPSNLNEEWVDSSGNIYQYDASTNEYFIEDVGNGREYGIFDITPARLFPSAKKRATLRIGGVGTVNVFDDTFDYTFYQDGLSTHIVNLLVNEEKTGYYLRWIDRHGELQYFLFANKMVTEKNSLDSDSISDMEAIGPMWFSNHLRSTQITSRITCKCSAVSLPRNIYEYVVTIVTSPVIDLYLGKSPSGREIWLPVQIVSANHDYDTTKTLNDMTIAFTLPEYKSQTL